MGEWWLCLLIQASPLETKTSYSFDRDERNSERSVHVVLKIAEGCRSNPDLDEMMSLKFPTLGQKG